MGTRDRKARLAVLEKANAPTPGLSYMQAQITKLENFNERYRLVTTTMITTTMIFGRKFQSALFTVVETFGV
jgi:hypothetical protein